MNDLQRDICKKLNKLGSSEAASWLIENYNFSKHNYGEAYIFIAHRSWRKIDQIRLSDYFLSNIAHSSDRGYRAFLSFMSLPLFINSIKKHIVKGETNMKLLNYYLIPSMRLHRDYLKYKNLVDEFIVCLIDNES